MFKSLLRRIDYTPVMSSQLHNEQSFYRAFVYDLKRCTGAVVIESPYLTVKRAQNLAPIFKKLAKRGVKVRINTREPRHHTPQLRQEAWAAIAILQRVGVKVYLCNDLRHRKLAVIDNTILWEGSLNILSQSRSREIMRRTVSKELCKQMVRFTKMYRKY